MFNLAVMMLAASTFLLNPPTGVSWAKAELHPVGDPEIQMKACSVSDVAVFSARASQIATDSLSDEQRDAYDDFFGIEGLSLPDPDWSYERLRKEIL